MNFPALAKQDPKIYEALLAEQKRQTEGIELIASENYVSQPVLEAMGTIFTNKYSEGYPGKRYYAGNEVVDTIENLAITRAKELFGAEYVNVQPLSGSPANFAVYFALLQPGDKVLGFKLDHGGHLSHGMHLNVSGKLYEFSFYGVEKETGLVDMEKVREIALAEKPKMIVAGFSAYSRDFDWKRFKEIADEVGALTMADIAHVAGLIAGKQIENPVPYFDVVTTTTHKTLRGPRGAIIMAKEKYTAELNRAVFPGLQGGPHDHINAAKAVAFDEALKPDFQVYAKQVIKNAQAMAGELMKRGYKIISDGTDNHLMLVDLVSSRNISGKPAVEALDIAGISANFNLIPFDDHKPFDPSGLRLGTAAITTRGMKEDQMVQIAGWIDAILSDPANEATSTKVHGELLEMTKQFPVPGIE